MGDGRVNRSSMRSRALDLTRERSPVENDEYVWPEPGRQFFQFGRTRADAYTWISPSLHEYAYMYRESAERLMDLACDAPGLLNVHALPAVFLFRHYVELTLKDMLVATRSLADQPAGFPDSHRLGRLWGELRTLLRGVGGEDGEGDSALLDVVEEMIEELDATDPDSMAFRYPRGRQSTGRPPLLSDEYEYFDMRVFRDQAKRLAHFFDGSSTQLSEWLDIKRDLDREYSWE
jgi:hypothetical protein